MFPLVFATALAAVAGEPATARADCSSTATHTITVRVRPWADVSVDGVVVARGVMTVDVALTEGPHSISFANPNAVADARTVLVPRENAPRELAVILERKPPRVEVRAPRDAIARIEVHIERAERTPWDDDDRATLVRTVRMQPGHALTIDVIADGDPLVTRRVGRPGPAERLTPRR